MIAGFMITGGRNTGRSAELFNPSSNNSCALPEMPSIRMDHTSCGILCGGTKETSTCDKINGNSIIPLRKLTLVQERRYHLCWKVPGEEGKTLLLGGQGGLDSPTTTELISSDSSSSEADFDLEYETK